jgi:heptosyltransferase III
MASIVYHTGALGDFITTLPAIARWREEHPGRQILLGRPEYAALAPPFDETWDAGAAAFSSLFSGSTGSDSHLGKMLGAATSALLFASSASPLAATLERLGVKEIVRQDPFPSSVIHVVDYHLSLFPGAAGESACPRVVVLEPYGQGDLGEVAAIHPGSGSARKNWPLERFVELAERLVERGRRIAWVIGPADPGVGALPGGVIWDCLPLPVLATKLAHCRLFVGNDSGITHLAAAVGCHTVALFGESDPRVWAPRGPRVTVIDSSPKGMETIEVGDVLRLCVDVLNEN